MTRYSMMPLFVDDLLGGTVHMTPAEFGGYIRLLLAAWNSEDGTITADDAMLRRISRFDNRNWIRARATILAKFIALPNGRLYNRRLMDERRKINRKTMSTAPCSERPVQELKKPNENSLGAVQHSRARACLPKPKNIPLTPLRETDGSPRDRGRARRPTSGPVISPNEFPPERRPINAANLTPEELAAKEAEAIAYIQGQAH